MQNPKSFQTLTKIFSETNTVEFGPFSVSMPKDFNLKDWQQVQCYANGQPLRLSEKLKKFLCGLILSADHIVSTDNMNDLNIAREDKDHGEGANILKVQIFNLKKTITEQTGNPELAKHFQSINPIKKHEQSGVAGRAKGYVLLENIPVLREEFNHAATLKHGAFEITKDTIFWQDAVLRVRGIEIPLQELIEKQLMAILIGKVNHTATFEDYAHQSKQSGLKNPDPKHLWAVMDKIKANISRTAGDEFAEQIQPIYLNEELGNSISGYRLAAQEP